MSIGHLFDRQPGLQLDFLPALDLDALLETVVAFANSEGGKIVVGADARGRVAAGGLQVEEAEGILETTLYRIRPPVRVEVETEELPQGTVLVFSVPRSDQLHSLEDGRVLARRGSENQVQVGADLALLVSGRGGGGLRARVGSRRRVR